MMTSSTNDGSKALQQEWQELEQEHAHLFTLFGTLECMTDRASALVAVADLEKWLGRHFMREEKEGGVLESITGEAEVSREVEALISEHDMIHKILAETHALLESTDAEAVDSDLVRQATAILGATLRSHEQRERALIERCLG